MSAQTPGDGAEEQRSKKPKVQPANWHPTGVGEIGDGPIAPQSDDELGDAPTGSDGRGAVPSQPKPENWHPTTEPTDP